MNADGTNPRCMLRPKEGFGEFIYGDIAWDTTGTKIVTTQWKSIPDIMIDRNVVTFSWEE